jgi:hypothetical protein
MVIVILMMGMLMIVIIGDNNGKIYDDGLMIMMILVMKVMTENVYFKEITGNDRYSEFRDSIQYSTGIQVLFMYVLCLLSIILEDAHLHS